MLHWEGGTLYVFLARSSGETGRLRQVLWRSFTGTDKRTAAFSRVMQLRHPAVCTFEAKAGELVQQKSRMKRKYIKEGHAGNRIFFTEYAFLDKGHSLIVSTVYLLPKTFFLYLYFINCYNVNKKCSNSWTNRQEKGWLVKRVEGFDKRISEDV